MVTHRNRMVRIMGLLSLFAWSLNGMAIPALFVNGAASASAEHGNDFAKSERVRPEANASSGARLADIYGKLPMSFEPNDGQFDSRVKFASRGRGYALFLTANEAVISLTRPVENDSSSDSGGQPNSSLTEPVAKPKATERSQSLSQSPVRPVPSQTRKPHSVLRMKLVNARRSPRAEPMGELPGKSNYFIGNDPAKWRTNVNNYAKVRYRSVYRGIDLVYYGDQERLEYDFNVAPGADPRSIRLRFDGAERVRIDSTGDLLLSASGGEIRQHKPVVYQEVDGTRKEILARYVVKSKNRVGFEVGRYDSRKALVIDPVLSYSTYLGGTVFDDGRSIALDTGGNAYVTGLTFSPDFPTMNPIQPSPNGAGEGYVTKLNKEGSALIYSTYLGGSLRDEGNGIAVDSGGNAYITGRTESTNFPIANAFQSSHTGTSSDAFVVKLSPDGDALTYSTYLGGNNQDFGRGIAVDAAGSAFVTGQTASSNFPTQNPLQPINSGGGFLTKFSPSGLALEYSTYIGGIGIGVALDSSGNAYVTGGTFRLDMPLVNPVQSQLKGQTVFKSIDGAANWTEINNGLTALSNVRTLALDPTVPTTVYIGLGGPGVFKSTNGGGSWSATNNTSFTLSVNQLVIDPTTPSTLYCRGSNDIGKSTDGGGSWNSLIFGSFGALAIDPLTTQNVYGGQGQGVFRSTNGGSTWQSSLVSNAGHLATTITGLAVDPVTPSTVFVVDLSSQVFASTNSGSTWRFIAQDSAPSNGILIDPSNHTTLYGWNGRFFAGATKSTDAGQTWASISSGLPGTLLRTMTIDPITTSTLYAGTLDGVYKSTNGGATWNHNQNRLTNAAVNAIAVDPLTTSTLYVGTDVTGDGFVAKLNSTGSALLYSTYLGGDVSDSAASIAVDDTGNAYVTGFTASLNFPTANALFSFSGAPVDAFVTKLNTAAPEIIYSTYLGGSSFDVGRGIAVDPSGNAYVTGQTSSMNFPQVLPLLPFGDGQLGEGFLTKLSASGTTLLFSTFLGGADSSSALAINSSGDAYLAGQVSSPNFTTTPGAFQPSLADPGGDAFVMKIGSLPSAVKLSSFKATGYDQGVLLNWETGFEAENLGFNIYREVAGKRTLVNPELVAGSALKAGANTRLEAGQSYSWWDKGIADCGLRIGDCPDAQYWLEEIDLNGTRTMHGPFGAHREGGEPSRERRADLLSSLGRGGPRIGQMPLVYSTVQSNSPEAKKSAMTLSSAGRKAFGLGPSPALKMTIREEGWYRVTRQDLVAAGFDVKSDPRRLRLYVEGEE